MPNIKELIFPYSQTGLTTVCIVMKQIATGYFLDHVDGVYRAVPVNPFVPLPELSSPEQGTYARDENRSVWPNGLYRGLVYPDATGTKAPIGAEEMYIADDAQVNTDEVIDNIHDDIAALLDIGSGDTAVNHNTGGVDNLRAVTALGVGIDNVVILAYLKTDYDAGGRTVKGASTTKSDGRWQHDMMLDAGFTYTLVFYKEDEYGPNNVEVSI